MTIGVFTDMNNLQAMWDEANEESRASIESAQTSLSVGTGRAGNIIDAGMGLEGIMDGLRGGLPTIIEDAITDAGESVDPDLVVGTALSSDPYLIPPSDPTWFFDLVENTATPLAEVAQQIFKHYETGQYVVNLGNDIRFYRDNDVAGERLEPAGIGNQTAIGAPGEIFQPVVNEKDQQLLHVAVSKGVSGDWGYIIMCYGPRGVAVGTIEPLGITSNITINFDPTSVKVTTTEYTDTGYISTTFFPGHHPGAGVVNYAVLCRGASGTQYAFMPQRGPEWSPRDFYMPEPTTSFNSRSFAWYEIGGWSSTAPFSNPENAFRASPVNVDSWRKISSVQVPISPGSGTYIDAAVLGGQASDAHGVAYLALTRGYLVYVDPDDPVFDFPTNVIANPDVDGLKIVPGPFAVSVGTDRLAYARGKDGIQIWDISTPTSPVLETTISPAASGTTPGPDEFDFGVTISGVSLSEDDQYLLAFSTQANKKYLFDLDEPAGTLDIENLVPEYWNDNFWDFNGGGSSPTGAVFDVANSVMHMASFNRGDAFDIPARGSTYDPLTSGPAGDASGAISAAEDADAALTGALGGLDSLTDAVSGFVQQYNSFLSTSQSLVSSLSTAQVVDVPFAGAVSTGLNYSTGFEDHRQVWDSLKQNVTVAFVSAADQIEEDFDTFVENLKTEVDSLKSQLKLAREAKDSFTQTMDGIKTALAAVDSFVIGAAGAIQTYMETVIDAVTAIKDLDAADPSDIVDMVAGLIIAALLTAVGVYMNSLFIALQTYVRSYLDELEELETLLHSATNTMQHAQDVVENFSNQFGVPV